MDSAAPTNTPTPPAPEGAAPAIAAVQPATPAQPAGDDSAALKAQLDALLKWKAEAEADLKKGRDARKAAEEKAAADKAEAEKKIREAGDFAKLHDLEREKRAALEAQLAELAPRAERLTAHEQRVMNKLEAAKAKGDLPGHIVRAIDFTAKVDVDEAYDILTDHLASIASAPAPKQPAPPAPAQGAAPASPAPHKALGQMTPAEIANLSDAQLNKMLGKADEASHVPAWRQRFFAK
jgi:hypothetical protein